MCKGNSCDTRHGILENGKEHSKGGRRGCITDTQALQESTVGKERADGGKEGLKRVERLVGEIVVGNGMGKADREKGIEDDFAPFAKRSKEKAVGFILELNLMEIVRPNELDTVCVIIQDDESHSVSLQEGYDHLVREAIAAAGGQTCPILQSRHLVRARAALQFCLAATRHHLVNGSLLKRL